MVQKPLERAVFALSVALLGRPTPLRAELHAAPRKASNLGCRRPDRDDSCAVIVCLPDLAGLRRTPEISSSRASARTCGGTGGPVTIRAASQALRFRAPGTPSTECAAKPPKKPLPARIAKVLKQLRAGGNDQRSVQNGTDSPTRALENKGIRRACNPGMGRLVHPSSADGTAGLYPASRA